MVRKVESVARGERYLVRGNVDQTLTFLSIGLLGFGLVILIQFLKQKGYLMLIDRYSLFICIFNHFGYEFMRVFNSYVICAKKQSFEDFMTRYIRSAANLIRTLGKHWSTTLV